MQGEFVDVNCATLRGDGAASTLFGQNKDLRMDVTQGRFREDLFARIDLWAYTLLGLAQRSEDI